MPLDPDCVRVHELYKMAGRPPLETLSVGEAREAMNRGRLILQPDPPEMGEVRNLTCPGPAGEIHLRLYRPRSVPAEAALLESMWPDCTHEGDAAARERLWNAHAASHASTCAWSSGARASRESVTL